MCVVVGNIFIVNGVVVGDVNVDVGGTCVLVVIGVVDVEEAVVVDPMDSPSGDL